MRLINRSWVMIAYLGNLGLKDSYKAKYEALAKAIDEAPVIEAEPVRHGRWIDEIEPNAVTASGREVHVFRCSDCDFTWANKTAVLHYFKYCPNCGAKMRGDVDA